MKNKIYLCSHQGCGKAYSAQVNLKRHIECIHLRLKDFVCHFCSKQLSSKQNFREHLYIHTGEKPFSCPLCGDAFRQGSQLSQHKKIHAVLRPQMSKAPLLKLTELTKFSEDRYFNPQASAACFRLPESRTKILLPDIRMKQVESPPRHELKVVIF